MFGLLKIIRKWQQRRETDAFRRVAEELHKSALFSRAILDSINDHIVILDVNTFEIVDANSTFMRVMGKPFDELVGRPCYAAIHGRSEICTGPEQTCPLLEMRETGQYASAEHIRYRNGIKKIAEVSASPIRDEQGTIVQVVHVAHDITARKGADEALRESEARYRDLFENANDLIQSVRFSDGAFLYVNRAWREAMGYSEEEMVHLKMFDVISPDCGAHCQETFGRVRQGERVDNVEAIFVAKDGRKINVEGSVNCSFVDGKPYATRGIFRDITERKQDHEILLRYADEVQEANDEVRNFSYIVSHDLRAPLVSIKGFSAELKSSLADLHELLGDALANLPEVKRQEAEKILNQDVAEAIGFIGSSVARMDGQINAILNLSRLGRREMKPVAVDVNNVVGSILSSLAHQLESKRVQVKVDQLPVVQADQVALEQIFGNLLDNALKYLDPERYGELHIWSESGQGEITFHVADNGQGIELEEQQKVFDLFRRAGKQDTPGEGMGLTYVRTLVKRQGGRIWLVSELGVGSTFSFTLPLRSLISNSSL